jgi:hypothetical protein
LVKFGILEPERRLDFAPGLLLAQNVGDIVGAERTRGMGLLQCCGDWLRAVVADQEKQFADLPG